MNKIKLICIDVDGTLYNDDKNIPEENIRAIQKAHEKGIQIAITTGRMFNYGKLYGSLLGVPTLTIASNGAFVKYKDQILNHQSISSTDLPFMISAVKDSGLFAH
ncbi:HAD family hydrolase [Proteiniclasticum sp.]|nr:HAD family hydrolase [Proteiniclasticum sp.]